MQFIELLTQSCILIKQYQKISACRRFPFKVNFYNSFAEIIPVINNFLVFVLFFYLLNFQIEFVIFPINNLQANKYYCTILIYKEPYIIVYISINVCAYVPLLTNPKHLAWLPPQITQVRLWPFLDTKASMLMQ